METTTIAAIATGVGGGVGIVRLSGPRALEIAGVVFTPQRQGLGVRQLPGRSCTLGTIRDGERVLDQALLLVFRAPASYTGEDVIELSCHGGRVVLEEVLALTIRLGAVPAARGEFTKRAFLAGKLSLTQAESVADIVAAQSGQGLRAAQAVREGALHRAVEAAADGLMDAAAHLAAWTDYPEEDVEEVLTRDLTHTLKAARNQLQKLRDGYGQGRMIRSGITTALVGSANVGKSTLMNLLAGYDRSIVTDIPGTTRDVIEETVRLGELTLVLWDTAGLRQTGDPVEQLGVERSRDRLAQSDLVLAVFDNSQPLTGEDEALLQSLEGRLAVGVINKTDLPTGVDRVKIAQYTRAVVEISAREGTGLPQLEEAIAQVAGLQDLDPSAALVANSRQLASLVAALDSLDEALADLGRGATLDGVSVWIQEALDHLLELTGRQATAEIIDRVFDQFCVGK